MTAYPLWPEVTQDALEQDLLARWQAEDLFQRTLDQTRDGPRFVFYEGPPTANGKPGIHHVFSRTIKDLICRFHAMQGKSVTRIAGWDTHGLPVEIEVEKQLKLSGKKDIERFGVEEFNRLSRESVFRYKADWEQLSDRIAFWLDYAHPYITYTNDYVESVWWLLARLHGKGLLYRGHRVLPYCPRCGTVLSSHELALGYEEVRDKSVYVTFPLEPGAGSGEPGAGQPPLELVVWTTTPWTLPSNVAAAVHPDLAYGVYAVPAGRDGAVRHLVIAEARAGAVKPGGTALAEHPQVGLLYGRDLVGRRYRRPLDVVPLPPEGTHSVVIPGDFVTADDGSGIVHMAPAFGADDYAAGQAHGLALLRPVAADGTFRGTTWPELEGRLVTAAETNDLLLRRLKEDGRHLLTEQHVHSYPHCWRCQSKLIYYARDSWFVRTSAVKDRMLAFNRDVGWHPPEVGAGRFGEWLENNVDWALSRDRYWGTPLPVWVCDRDPDHVEVVGSYRRFEGPLAAGVALEERWGRPLPPDFDPHKPFIDRYTWACACGGTLRRTPEVIDTWFDSGSMPSAQWHYPFEHAEEFRTHFPADYICEGVDQTRGWFYSLLAIAAAAFDSTAYRNVIVNELVLDADGQKMSKSRGNVVDPWAVVAAHGADAVRLYLVAASQVWLPKRFDASAIPEVAGRFLTTLRSTYNFLALYAGPGAGQGPPPPLAPVDRWLLARLDTALGRVTAAWAGYDVTTGTRALMDFVVDDLSNWYVRVNRGRFWAPGQEADPAAAWSLHAALVAVARMLAPVAPFASDWLHRALVGSSVHLAPFPAPAGAAADSLERAMDAVRRLASLARSAREDVNLRVRQPVRRARVAVPAQVRGPAFDGFLDLFRLEVNVKDVEVVGSDADLVQLRARPNFRSLGKRYGKDTPAAAGAASALDPDQLRRLEAGGTAEVRADGRVYEYRPEDVTVERDVLSDWAVRSDGPYVVAVDPHLDDGLRREGMAREVVSRVQRLRKEAGYDYTTRISVAVAGPEPILSAASTHADFIREETLARELAVGGRLPGPDLEQELDIDGFPVTIGVRRHG